MSDYVVHLDRRNERSTSACSSAYRACEHFDERRGEGWIVRSTRGRFGATRSAAPETADQIGCTVSRIRSRAIGFAGQEQDLNMLTNRSVALAMMLIGLAEQPARAATCNLTVMGVQVLNDAACTATATRGITRVADEDGSAITIRGSAMIARLAGEQVSTRQHHRGTTLGDVVTSDNLNDKICYFGQKAVLCVEQ